MTNSFYNETGNPATGTKGISALMRAEFVSIRSAFDLFPTLVGNAGKALVVSAGAAAISLTTGALALAGDFTTTGAFNTTLIQSASVTLTLPGVSGTLATLAGAETFTNKTLTNPTITGATTSGGTISSATITGATTSGGTINSAVIGGTIPAAGSFTTLSSTGNSTIGGTLAVTGNATIGGTLGVTGTLSGTITVFNFATTWATSTYPGTNVANYSTQIYTGSPVTGFADTQATNDVALNVSYISSDQLNLLPNLTNALVTGWNFVHRYGGGSASGPRTSFSIDSYMTGALATTAAFPGNVALNVMSGQTANWAGAASGAGNGKGDLFATAVYYGGLSSGVFAYGVWGGEWILNPASGSQASYVYGIKWTNNAPVGWHGLINEAVFSFCGGGAGGNKWNHILYFGNLEDPANGFPATATGDLLFADVGTVANAIDFHNVTCTDSLLKGANASISGAGAFSGISYKAQPVGGANVVIMSGNTTGNSPNIVTSGSDSVVGLDLVMQGGNSSFRIFGGGGVQVLQAFAATSSNGFPFILSGIAASTPVQIFPSGTANNLLVGGSFQSGSLATGATTGYLVITSSAGPPTGVPINLVSGVALHYDRTNNQIYVYNGAWKKTVALT